MWFHLRILEACNLHCTGCYAKDRDRSARMDFEMFRDVLDTILRIDGSRRGKSVVYLSGGEPLIHSDIFRMVDESCRCFDRVNILTNGMAIPDALPRLLPYREKLCVQVSLDGDQATNDQIRGAGAYAAAVTALHALNQSGLPHWLSYTVSQTNRHCYDKILEVARATDSRFNNVTPYTGDPNLMLGYLEWKEFKYRFDRASKPLALGTAYGPNSCGFNYDCGAFFGGLTVNPDGTLAGCARMKQTAGRYQDMQRHLRTRPQSMHEACMRAKWGQIRNFRLLTRLET